MTPTFSEPRSTAIRDALEHHVADSLSPTRSVRRWLPGVSLLALGLVVGGAVSAAAVTTLQPVVRTVDGIEAPPGVYPGESIVSLLGGTTSTEVSGSSTFQLPAAPEGATHLRVTVTCLTAGATSWGPDPDGNNPSISCGAGDVGTRSATAWYDFPLAETNGTFTVGANDSGRALLALQYVNYVETQLGVNESGETYGVDSDRQHPDLLLAAGVGPDGTGVEAYARASDFNAFGPEWPDQPSNPTEALKWQSERDAKYPNGWDIPLYESDGKTQVGTFHISNG